MDSGIVTGEVLRRLVSDNNSRADRRKTSDSRANRVLDSNIVARSLGSAMVAHGSTLVVCAAAAELSPVLPDAPSRGYVEVEVVYNAATCFTVLPHDAATLQPQDDRDPLWAAEASCLLQRAVDLSGCVDLEALLISEGEACWALRLTCVVLQDDGGVLDACCAAVRAALATASLPTEVVTPDGARQLWAPSAEHATLAAVGATPRVATVGYLFVRDGANVPPSEATEVVVVVDPTAAEAAVMDGCISVASSALSQTTAGGGRSSTAARRLLSLTCHGGKPVSAEVIEHVAKFALEHTLE